VTVSQEEFESLKSAVANLRRQITDMEEQMNNHVGLDWGATGINYPHPNQSVSSLEFGGSKGRLDNGGIKLTGSYASDGWITYLAEHHDGKWFEIDFAGAATAASINESTGQATLYTTVAENLLEGTNTAIVQQDAGPTGHSRVLLSALAGGQSTFVEVSQSNINGNYVMIGGAPLRLPTAAGGYSLATDGQVDYDTTADKMRLRQNGSTVNIATEDYVDTAITGVSGHTDIMSRLSLRF